MLRLRESITAVDKVSDRRGSPLILERLFDRYTTEGRHLPDGSMKSEAYLEHARQSGRYLAQFFGRDQAVSELTPDRVHDYVVWQRNGGCLRPTRRSQHDSARPGDVQSGAELGVPEV